MSGRVVLVVVSPRVPPGLLSWPAWEALRSGPVLTADAGSPQLPFLADAGVEVTVVEPSPSVLLEHAAEVVVWLTTGDADADLVREVGMAAVRSGVVVEQVHGSYDPPGARLLDVVAVMDRLRSPGGCPWDAQQTHASLKPYLLEEAYEAYQALEDGDLDDLREELGDVLLQVAFHARIAEQWDIDDVAGDLVDKLVRRHPHVFAGASADDLEGSWEALKQAEKGRASVTDGVPLGQPALSLAAKLQKRGSRVGAPVPPVDGLGGELWSLVARCRSQGLDPEVELRAVARAYRDRLAAVEAGVRAEGREPGELSAQEWQSPVELIGTVVRLQVQRSRLKPAGVYDPAPLLQVPHLDVGPRGCTGPDGVLDVHHADHPDSRNRGSNGLSLLPRTHYDELRARYGDHLADGAAGESVLLDTDGPWRSLDGPLLLETADGGLLELTDPVPAAPCVEFSRFCLGGSGSDDELRATLDHLDGGTRGFYVTAGGTGRIEPGARLLRRRA